MTATSSLNGLLKKVYTDKEIENIQNMEAKTYKMLKKSSKKPGGLGFEASVTVEGNQRGMGSQNELESLRTPAVQTPVKPLITPKVTTHTIKFSGLYKAITETNEEAFAEGITYQTDEGLADTFKELNQYIYRDGSGKIADANGAGSGSTTVTFDGGVPTHFRVGQYIDIITGGSKEADSVKITAVDIENKQLTIDTSSTWTDNAAIYREDTNDAAPSDGKEWAGLPLACDDTTLAASYQNVNRSTYSIYQGITVDASDANLSDDLLMRTCNRVKIESGKEPNMLCMNPMQERKYLNILTPAKEFRNGDTPDTNFDVVPTWSGKPIAIDTDCGFDDVYFMNKDVFKKFLVKDVHLDDTTGEIFRWDNGFDAYVILIKAYGNFGVEGDPKAIARLKNLAEPTY